MLKTNNGDILAIEEISLTELLNTITQMHPDLAHKIKAENEQLNVTFYKASYRFGDDIIHNGKCYLPLKGGGTISFNDSSLPNSLQKDLNYDAASEDPLGLIVNKTSEFYLPGDSVSHIHSLINPGQIFGVLRAIDNHFCHSATSVLELNLTAGARSIFMLPKISSWSHHVHLQEQYGLKQAIPATLQDHHNIFVEIANKSNCKWRCEVIYFPRKWINQLKNDSWAALAKYLMLTHRATYSTLHKVTDIWTKTFHEIEQERLMNKKYPMQSLAITKNLFFIAANVIPGFKPATNDNLAPISLIQQAYNEVYNKYNSNPHSSIIMEPGKLNSTDVNHVYYSINYSRLTKKYLETVNKKSQIAWLEEIRQIMEIYNKAILCRPEIKTLCDTTKNTNFSFYHSNPDNYKKINNSCLLPNSDARFSQIDGNDFPQSSPFFKGCIQISHISN